MRYVELTTVADLYQAHFLKKALEDEGVHCMVINETTNQLIGSWIQVRVSEQDQIQAVRIFQELKAKTDKAICPNCNSENVEFGLRKKYQGIQGLLLSVLAFTSPIIPPSDFIHVYRCKGCGTEFRKSKF